MLIPYTYSLNEEAPDKWIISFETGSHFIVNLKTVKFMGILKKSADMKNAYKVYCDHDEFQLCSFNEFTLLTGNIIDRLKLAVDKEYKAQPSYIHFKFSVIPTRYIKYVTKPFTSLFTLKIFITTYIFSLLFNLSNLYFINTELIPELSYTNVTFIIIPLLLSTLFHEIGHLAACRQYNAKHGEMGFGFYFIFPVAYSDVTGIWALPKYQRILVNLSGVYMELLYTSILFTLSHWFPSLAYIGIIIMIRVAYTFIPFLRNDGYWILSDLLNEQNLLPRSRKILNKLFKHVRNLNSDFFHQLDRKEKGLLVYGIINALYFPLFMIYIATSYTNYLVNFPYLLTKLVSGEYMLNKLSSEFYIASIFYLLLTIRLVKILRKVLIKSQYYTNSQWKNNDINS
ncbi:MAG: hypothetical protein V7780_03270 [Colwellia sp.]|uniref:hypothetical protein n=1 Tax=Colwellia sp. Bg11-12 TaxID=2759817 RepID=UPI0015F5E3E8|nr:hypothetical protein [Colwellia sp. Bg11-12]MBA6264105.1 hypothetical protein [Colwellia sp. Bg11-12]